MRVYYVALLASAVMLTSTAAESATIDSKISMMNEFSASTRSLHYDALVTRHLRTGDEDEERVINIPVLEQALANSKKLKELKQSGKTADEAFSFLKLKQVEGSLLSNNDFKLWKRYVAKLNSKDPRGAMISTLRAQFDDKKLSIMLQEAKKVKSTKSFAIQMQDELFKLWYTKSEYELKDVVTTVFKLDGPKWREVERQDPRWDVYSNYITYVRNNYDESFGGEFAKPIKSAKLE
ncbi:putative secreted RxLR effector protein [Phytophthora cinnamomi]|uniref:putative secreted RxLR effector protein n=1 Tax=Phytophthora cinnamomi TaxID=4785 RepID=UPI00355A48F3|nr:putative secreted RxLR effector protein [Phytophthora cinnamomi]